MGFKYELRLENGDTLGSFESSLSNWKVGEDLHYNGRERYRVMAVEWEATPPVMTVARLTPAGTRPDRLELDTA